MDPVDGGTFVPHVASYAARKNAGDNTIIAVDYRRHAADNIFQRV